MSETPNVPSHEHLWAPWRMEYIDGLGGDDGCFLCAARDATEKDAENFMLFRGEHNLVILNRFPYTGGHCLVAPYEHVGSMDPLPEPAMLEMMGMLRDLQTAITEALGAEGFNVGFNIGHCAGAGLPGHIHGHLVPRWSGDTNFMSVLGDVRVIPEFLAATRRKILDAAADLTLPTLKVDAGA